jgi:mannose-6-phosphate isomerase class I
VKARSYNANPVIEFPDLELREGWNEILQGSNRFALDGPIDLPWDQIMLSLSEQGFSDIYDFRVHQPSEQEIYESLAVGSLSGHEFFGKIPSSPLINLIPNKVSQDVCIGPGSAVLTDRITIFLDRPKRISEAAAIADGVKLQRLYFYDWPISDRQRELVIDSCHLYVDLSDIQRPVGINPKDLAIIVEKMSTNTLRTLPYFNDAVWGGNWAKNLLGVNSDLMRTALGYEFIAPESAVKISNNKSQMEIPVSVLLSIDPEGFVGGKVAQYFKGDFPIRFDYLDTYMGENLSIHVHPGSGQMQEVFGVLYGQEESYYVMANSTDSVIYLGLDGEYQDSKSILSHPAEIGQLYLIPHGTPHGSGKGNVVLEASTTPYLYSLRLHDWERVNSTGFPRPLNEKLALSMIDSSNHRGQMSPEFIPTPSAIDSGAGYLLELLGSRPDWYFEVLRLTLNSGARYSIDLMDSFLLANVVDGDFIEANGNQYAYAETFMVPARMEQIDFKNISDREVVLLIGRMKNGWSL